MRLYTFEYGGTRRIGAELGGRLVDLNAAQAAALSASGQRSGTPFPVDMLALLRDGTSALQVARRALAFAAQSPSSLVLDFSEVRLCAPIPRPGKILCSGVNYKGHLDENPGAVLPKFPFFFSKVPSAVIGPGDPIIKPVMTNQLDYEVELAVVIGKKAKNLTETEAIDCVAGYTILHDVSARDIQFQDSQITLGKNFDSFAPMGPCLVTADELSDLSDVRLRTLVNGQVMQDGTTADWFTPLPELLAFLSSVMSLEPGDVISTGTPAGIGYFRQPQVFLQPGDRVAVEVAGIGRLENPVIDEGGRS
jgi:2,4-diketo-3-deoxy-L-fuconate hydrolase